MTTTSVKRKTANRNTGKNTASGRAAGRKRVAAKSTTTRRAVSSSNTARGRHSIKNGSRSTTGNLSGKRVSARKADTGKVAGAVSVGNQPAQFPDGGMGEGLAMSKRYKVDLISLVISLCAILLAISLYAGSLGPAGVLSRHYLGVLMGITRFALPPLFLIVAVYIVLPARLLNGRVVKDLPWQTGASVVVMGCLSGLADIAGGLPGISVHPAGKLLEAGGWVGVGIGGVLNAGIGSVGAVIVLVALGLFSLLIITGITLRQVFHFVAGVVAGLWSLFYPKKPLNSVDQPDGSLSVDSADGFSSGMSEEAEATGFASAVYGSEWLHAVNSDLQNDYADSRQGEHSDYSGGVLHVDEDTPAGGSGMPDSSSGMSSMDADHEGAAVVGELGSYAETVVEVGGGDGLSASGLSADTSYSGHVDRGGTEIGEIAGVASHTDGSGDSDREGIQQRLFALKGQRAWKLPPIQLLSRSVKVTVDKRDISNIGRALVGALATHGVETRLSGFTVGPTVTRYELELGPGVKVARVTSLSKDIAYAMASPDVRILAPIPGKSAIGIEVPNRERELITLGDLLSSKDARAAKHPLSIPLGRDISGKSIMTNLADMPHLLISGATGSGKSSFINSMLTGILLNATPEQVRLILIDPKRVELGPYKGLPHLLTEVVVDPRKAANALAWAVEEMDRRYRLLAGVGARDIGGYNETVDALNSEPVGIYGESSEYEEMPERGEDMSSQGVEVPPEGGESLEDGESLENEETLEPLPYIVIVVDELNDLMMVAARDVEESVCRIAQMARAVGIHLVLATQRPSVDVITGVIKANIPSRLAFAVSSLADSRVILDQPGAERLIGKGDMLMLTASSSVPRRIQGAWIDTREVHSVVAYWKRQGSVRHEIDLDDANTSVVSSSSSQDDDDLVNAALELVVNAQLGSTSMLQRKLKVGFARAGRLMDILERKGVVGPSEGSKARAVLMTPEELSEMRARRQ